MDNHIREEIDVLKLEVRYLSSALRWQDAALVDLAARLNAQERRPSDES